MSGQRLVAGFMPLLDCATLVAAVECGFAASEGLDLRLVRETSWANIRDRVLVGQFDVAHMLGPMVVATTLGISHLQASLITPVALGMGGNAVSVSNALYEAMLDADLGDAPALDARAHGMALQRVVRARAAAGEEPLTLAMVYPFSCHNYQLRYWLGACGIHPDQDVRMVVIPPPLLVDALRQGHIDGFCAGEPWSSVAVASGVGHIVTTGTRIWPNAPEKVLGMRADWAEQHSTEVTALVRSIVRAARWCDDPHNHSELAHLLSGPRYVGTPAAMLLATLSGELPSPGGGILRAADLLAFSRNHANLPWPTHALWFYSQMVRWRQVADTAAARLAAAGCFRADLYRAAAAAAAPQAPVPPESPYVERFFDGAEFRTLHESGADA